MYNALCARLAGWSLRDGALQPVANIEVAEMREGDATAGVQWRVVAETAALLGMYALGLLVAWLVWPPLSLLYLAVILASNLLFMARICPYCQHVEAMNCHSGYHHVARFFRPREGKTFAQQFQRNVAVMYPVWGLPPLVGLYGLITRFSSGLDWGLLVAIVMFCLVGFVLLPIASQKTCAGCASAQECPRGASRVE
jgi:hypothetical protein